MHIKLSTVTLLWQICQMNLMLLLVSLILVQLPAIMLHLHAHNQLLLSWNNNYPKSKSHHLDTALRQNIKVTPLFWRKQLPSFDFDSTNIVFLFLNSLQYTLNSDCYARLKNLAFVRHVLFHMFSVRLVQGGGKQLWTYIYYSLITGDVAWRWGLLLTSTYFLVVTGRAIWDKPCSIANTRHDRFPVLLALRLHTPPTCQQNETCLL
jgi:hypothetical protein